jgi:Tol biopolymer transport system component
VYEELIRRHERKRIARKVQAGALAVLVIAGTVASVYGLARVFRSESSKVSGVIATNGRIAFADYRIDPACDAENGFCGWHIYSMNYDGSDVADLTPNMEEATQPSYSPDGTRIAFHGWQGRDDGIYVMMADGSDVAKILSTDQRQDVFALAWSPDGSRIAYIVQEPVGPLPEIGAPHDFSYTLWMVNANGSHPIQLTTVGREFSLSWSPDGSRIVFERYEPMADRKSTDGEGQGQSTGDLYVIGADGSNERRLTYDGDAHDPAWSPDGSKIAFVGERHTDEGILDIYVINSDGTGRTRLTSDLGNEYDPVWAPDGTEVAYATRELDPKNDESVCHIRVMEADGSNVRNLIAAPGSEECPGQSGISWAPLVPGEPSVESISPVDSPAASSTPPEDPASDIGLGFPVCNVTSVEGRFGDAQGVWTAYVATKRGDVGPCPNASEADNVVAIDVTGDGQADTSFGPIACQGACTAFAAPDIDGDGTDELLVQDVAFSIAGLRLFEVGWIGGTAADGPFLSPVTVAPPGDLAAGYEPGKELRLWLGGDAFRLDALRCESGPDGQSLVATSAESKPHDSPDAVWYAHETTFRLQPDGTIDVVGTRDFQEPATSESPSFATRGGLCGARLPSFYAGD